MAEKVIPSSSNIAPFPRRSDSEVKLDLATSFATRFIARQDVKFARAQILSFGFALFFDFCASQLSYIRYAQEKEKQGKG